VPGLPDKAELAARVAPHRAKWAQAPRPAGIVAPGPGQESVWDFPRPPAVEPVAARLRVEFAGRTVAQTTRGLRVVETAGAPVYHFPPQDVAEGVLVPTGDVTICEWKGAAAYFDLVVDGNTSRRAAYAYPDPLDDLGRGFSAIAGWIVFYAGRVDAAFVGDAAVTPQPGGYYAGWVTADLVGPIKGEPGSEGW